MRFRHNSFAQVLLFAAVLFAAPRFLPNDYYLTVLIIGCINAIIAAGLNLLLGYAGQISLGHAAFYGIASYVTAVVTSKFGLPMELGLVAAVGVTALVALLIGIPTLKLSGHYLAMATLGFGLIVYIFFNETVGLTGGPSGYTGIPRLKLLGYAFTSDHSYYYLVAGALALVLLVSLNLINSRFGRALRAIHTSEKAAQVSGVDIATYKLLVFVLSAVFAALAGFLYAHYLTFIAPASFSFMFSVALITMVVLGGMANMWGAVTGAFFITALPQFLQVFETYEVLIFGAILIVCMMYLPDGIVGGGTRLARRVFGRLGKQPANPAGGAPHVG
jgi:branched-chain amino acid transport system permease protein